MHSVGGPACCTPATRCSTWPPADGSRRPRSTVVHFADVSDAEIEAYLATGEPLGVAGAFTIDGRGAAFVDRIEGDHGTVIGLSLPLLRTMLAELGHPITDLWR